MINNNVKEKKRDDYKKLLKKAVLQPRFMLQNLDKQISDVKPKFFSNTRVFFGKFLL